MIFGKIFGALFGFLLFGGNIFGLAVGVYLGHLFDKGLKENLSEVVNRFHKTSISQDQFFSATFLFMGYIAKLDGRVSEREINVAREVMQRLSLNEEQKKEAIFYFTQGKDQAFSFESTLRDFSHQCRMQPQLAELFLEMQVQSALADGPLTGIKKQVLLTLCQSLNISRITLEELESQFSHFKSSNYHSSQNSRKQYYHKENHVDELTHAYRTLAIDKNSTDAEIKKAYRKLINQTHPDKLIAKGLPPEMIKLATEKTQKIHKAYELIKRERGL